MTWTKRILPHGSIDPIAENLWQVSGRLPRMALPRNMLIYRLPDGGLWIHSAVAMEEASMVQLEKLGRPSILVVPNGYHRLDAPAYKSRYPKMRVLCPAESRKAVESKIAVDGTVEDELPKLGIEVLAPAGAKPVECAYRLPVPGGAIAFCDLVFNVPKLPGFGGRILHWLGSTDGFGVTKIGRRFMVADAAALADWFEKLAQTGPEMVTMAHGDAILSDGAKRLREAAAKLR